MPVKTKKPVRKRPVRKRGQRSLVSVDRARRQLSAVLKVTRGGNERFVAYSRLLSRAYGSKRPNPEVIRMVSAERNKLIKTIKWPGEKPFKTKLSPAQKRNLSNASQMAETNFKNLSKQISKQHFKNAGILIHLLVTDTPKSHSGIIASSLESLANKQELKFLRHEMPDPSHALTISKLYSASSELYRKRGPAFFEKAEEMITVADIFKARSQHGI